MVVAIFTDCVAPPCVHSGMKLLITPLLSGLLENDFNKMTEFDDFFKEIEKINRKKVMTAHQVYNACAFLVLFVKFGYMHMNGRE